MCMVSQCQLSSLSMPGNCAFNVKWQENDEYKQWLVMGQSMFKTKCTLCRKEIDISNMGEGALKSHKKSNQGFIQQEGYETRIFLLFLAWRDFMLLSR